MYCKVDLSHSDCLDAFVQCKDLVGKKKRLGLKQAYRVRVPCMPEFIHIRCKRMHVNMPMVSMEKVSGQLDFIIGHMQ